MYRITASKAESRSEVATSNTATSTTGTVVARSIKSVMDHEKQKYET